MFLGEGCVRRLREAQKDRRGTGASLVSPAASITVTAFLARLEGGGYFEEHPRRSRLFASRPATAS